MAPSLAPPNIRRNSSFSTSASSDLTPSPTSDNVASSLLLQGEFKQLVQFAGVRRKAIQRIRNGLQRRAFAPQRAARCASDQMEGSASFGLDLA